MYARWVAWMITISTHRGCLHECAMFAVQHVFNFGAPTSKLVRRGARQTNCDQACVVIIYCYYLLLISLLLIKLVWHDRQCASRNEVGRSPFTETLVCVQARGRLVGHNPPNKNDVQARGKVWRSPFPELGGGLHISHDQCDLILAQP